MKKLKAQYEENMKKAQKDFCWDDVAKSLKDKEGNDGKAKPMKTIMKDYAGTVNMSKDMAMKTLGLSGAQGSKKPKSIADYSEDEIYQAFQGQFQQLSKYLLMLLPITFWF